MAITQQELANQMIKQLRVLDPSASGELGTPERKIIDTVAQSLSDAQIDLNVLSASFDLDSKVGTDLDQFLSVFGFARQRGTFASGVVEFSRDIPFDSDIRIPFGTQLAAQVSLDNNTATTFNQALFQTTADVILQAGSTIVSAPIRSTQVGAFNNVAANTVTTFVGTPVLGVTSVSNPTPTSGGTDSEEDDALKVRFRNTVFRNLAGTSDQFLALAVAGVFTNKANVIGPISRFREYLQIPPVDDSLSYDVNGDNITENGNGAAAEFSTALSTLPYSKFTYDTVPVFLSNGTYGIGALFYMQDVDFVLNTTPPAKNRGDAYRMGITGEGPNPLSDDSTATQPNVTATNVYTGEEPEIQAIRPNDTVLFEHSYMSSASRNDWSRNITNCVDVYVNGGNPTLATATVPAPDSTINVFADDPTYRLHFDNFRRVGEPDHRPIIGNLFTPLFWTPILDIPDTLVFDDTTFYEGIHYWAVEDVSENRGTVRARTGIEWSNITPGQAAGDSDNPESFTGSEVSDTDATAVEIKNYSFDKNIVDLQTALEGSKQITTDVLVHQARIRYFRFDVSVIYEPGASASDTNQSIHDALEAWLGGLFFGSVIQLSDVLQQIHNVTGVDSVRWSRDVDPDLACVTETNALGIPRLNVVVETTQYGDLAIPSIQNLFLTGDPTGGTFTINDLEIPYDANAATLQAKLDTLGVDATVHTSPVPDGSPQKPFRIEWDNPGHQSLLEVDPSGLLGGSTTFNEDFFLQDSELPALPDATAAGDTLSGLILRSRTQSTWRRG
jgi:uncharacterized phage protein gp47/JayE